MIKGIVQYGQSIFDLALQYYGSAEGIFLLIKDNPELVPSKNWHDDPIVGTVIYIKSAAINQNVVDYYAKNVIAPATLFPLYAVTCPPGSFGTDFNNDFNITNCSGNADFNNDFNNDYL